MQKEYREEIPPRALRLGDIEFFKMITVNWRAMAAHTHIHDAIEFIYMNRGSVRVSINGEKTSIYPGDLVLFHSRSIHDIWTEDEVENDYYVLKILPSVLYSLFSSEKANDFARRFLASNTNVKNLWRKDEIKGSDIELGLQRLVESLDVKNQVSDISRTIFALLVLDGIYRFDNTIVTTNEYVANESLHYALFYINEHFNEPISVEDVAQKANMSISSFSRAFKKASGQNFKDYLNTVRTNMAKELLLNTELPVREVAVRVGYNNISHFIATYKRYKGKTPLEERKKN